MKNIRKIITERLENAKNDLHYNDTNTELDWELLKGQIEAYQDCLNLIPAPRTEQDILNEFEKLGYKLLDNHEVELELRKREYINEIELTTTFYISKEDKTYQVEFKSYDFKTMKKIEFGNYITMQEHKLLNELFEVIFNE